MFVLEYKYPVAVNVGKVDYNMVYRWKQIAMCEYEKPLKEWIKNQQNQDLYRIEKYPN